MYSLALCGVCAVTHIVHIVLYSSFYPEALNNNQVEQTIAW